MTKKPNRFAKDEKILERKLTRLQRHTLRLGENLVSPRAVGRFVRILGPGLVTGAADDDPSGIATYSQAGAQFGYGLLWAFPLMYPLLMAVQESCARIGAVTGKGLAEVIKENYSKKLLYMAVLLVVVANVINIGADLGAMAATTQLFVSSLPFALLAVAYAVLIVLLMVFVNYKTYAKVLKWLALALFSYPLTALLVGQNWPQVFHHTFTVLPKLDATTLYIFVGMLGTTISPYLFFWDTSEVVEEEIAKRRLSETGKNPKISERFLKNLRLDNFAGMTLATVTAWFIVIACAATLFQHGITQINTASDAARALEPLVHSFPNAGLVAKLIFSVGIVGVGLLAVPVLAGSSSYAISEAAGWKEGLYRKFKRATGFYTVIIAATFVGLIINFLGVDPIKALVFAAVFNSVSAVPLLFMIAKIGNNQKIMGAYKNKILSNLMVRLAFGVMAVAVIALLVLMATGKGN